MKTMLLRRTLITLFSAGWLLPLWVSVDLLFVYSRADLVPRLLGQHPVNSFPFLQASQTLFAGACVWLAAALLFWAWRVTKAMEACTEVKNQLKGSAMKASTPLILATALLAAVALPATLRAQEAPAAPAVAKSDPDIRAVDRKVLQKQYEAALKELAEAETAEAAAATPEQKATASKNLQKQRKWIADLKAKLDQGEPGANPKVAARAPSKPVEEDLAFFEKKYGRKITGVKPKSEYDDPDKFYSLIGEQLGIPEIAWKAAAEKYGWKQDDGKNTFTMLKGGPVFGALQGSWEVLIMRSKPNPETKKPDLKTMEQVMVQVDYDGNVKFPEHGIEHKRLRIPTEPGHSMEETAKILIHDIQFGDRAKEKAIQHGDDIIPLIRKETKDFTVLVRADWIADVLGAIKTESSRKVLLDLYSRTNDLTRLVGAVGLARQGALTGPVDEHSFLVRMAALERSPHNEMAIRALGLSRDEKALPFLVDLLKKGRGARLDGVTCEALAAIGSKDAIPVLRDCLKADKFYALPSAFRALIILGDRDAIPLAIARLTPEDKRSGGARWIVVDLRLMTGEKFGFDQASWLQWWDSAKGSWQIPEKFRKPWDYKDYMGMEAK